jgi:hypothetical protein
MVNKKEEIARITKKLDSEAVEYVERAARYAVEHGYRILWTDGCVQDVAEYSVMSRDESAVCSLESGVDSPTDAEPAVDRLVREDDYELYCPARCGQFGTPKEEEGGCRGEGCVLFTTRLVLNKGVRLALCGLSRNPLGVHVTVEEMSSVRKSRRSNH